jgi:GTP-binding protein Era
MPTAPPRPTRFGHVALAGKPNVGKSSLLNAVVGSHLAIVSPKAQATRLPVTGLRTDGGTQYVLHDLPGLFEPSYLMQVRMRELALDALTRADLILHLHPAPEAPAPSLADLLSLERLPLAPVFTVYTKGDLVGSARRADLEREAAVVSVAEGWGLESLLARIAEMLPEGEHHFDPEDLGTQPLRFFAAEYVREAAFSLLEDELPYALNAQVEEFRESERPVYIRVHLYVERDSQKRIVIGGGGRTIKAIGAQARARLEELIGAPVYLDLWVKVLPHWRTSPAALTRFGFPGTPEAEVS